MNLPQESSALEAAKEERGRFLRCAYDTHWRDLPATASDGEIEAAFYSRSTHRNGGRWAACDALRRWTLYDRALQRQEQEQSSSVVDEAWAGVLALNELSGSDWYALGPSERREATWLLRAERIPLWGQETGDLLSSTSPWLQLPRLEAEHHWLARRLGRAYGPESALDRLRREVLEAQYGPWSPEQLSGTCPNPVLLLLASAVADPRYGEAVVQQVMSERLHTCLTSYLGRAWRRWRKSTARKLLNLDPLDSPFSAQRRAELEQVMALHSIRKWSRAAKESGLLPEREHWWLLNADCFGPGWLLWCREALAALPKGRPEHQSFPEGAQRGLEGAWGPLEPEGGLWAWPDLAGLPWRCCGPLMEPPGDWADLKAWGSNGMVFWGVRWLLMAEGHPGPGLPPETYRRLPPMEVWGTNSLRSWNGRPITEICDALDPLAPDELRVPPHLSVRCSPVGAEAEGAAAAGEAKATGHLGVTFCWSDRTAEGRRLRDQEIPPDPTELPVWWRQELRNRVIRARMERERQQKELDAQGQADREREANRQRMGTARLLERLQSPPETAAEAFIRAFEGQTAAAPGQSASEPPEAGEAREWTLEDWLWYRRRDSWGSEVALNPLVQTLLDPQWSDEEVVSYCRSRVKAFLKPSCGMRLAWEVERGYEGKEAMAPNPMDPRSLGEPWLDEALGVVDRAFRAEVERFVEAQVERVDQEQQRQWLARGYSRDFESLNERQLEQAEAEAEALAKAEDWRTKRWAAVLRRAEAIRPIVEGVGGWALCPTYSCFLWRALQLLPAEARAGYRSRLPDLKVKAEDGWRFKPGWGDDDPGRWYREEGA
jgi:hypothetical protein